MPHRLGDQQFVFFHIHGRRFAGRADHHDAIRALLNVKIDQPAERRQVEAAVLVHRGDDRNNTALHHLECSPEN